MFHIGYMEMIVYVFKKNVKLFVCCSFIWLMFDKSFIYFAILVFTFEMIITCAVTK